MQLLESVSAERVVKAFCNDQKVKLVGSQWPDTSSEQIAHVRKSGRPVDFILSLAWGLYALDREELLSKLRPVWCPHESPDYCWTLKQMFTAIRAGTFKPPEPNTVPKLEAEMKAQFRDTDFLLIGYWHNRESILLEDGHNRVTAAFLAGALPATVKMYVGQHGVIQSIFTCRSVK